MRTPSEEDRLEPSRWQQHLTTRALGRGEVCFMQQVDSTNSQLKRMAAEGAPHGSLCLCEEQTAGRGRLGRTWISRTGTGLWQSVLLRPSLPPERAPLFTFCAALAMADAIRAAAGLDAGIKWPNDLVIAGRKVCGILLEMSAKPGQIEYIIIGAGLNVRRDAVPPELAGQAASLEDFTDPPPRHSILTAYLASLEALTDAMEHGGWEAVSGMYNERCITIGSRVRVSGAVECTGIAESVDQDGALLVLDDSGNRHRVLSGDVSVRGVMGYV